MKKAVVLKGIVALMIATFSGSLLASGTVWSEVKDNVACVYHDDASFNCCPKMVMTSDIYDDTTLIDIFEQDTQPACDCMCYYDFTHTFEGLAPGQYTVKVWESGCKECEFTLAGTTTFVIVSKINPLVVFDTMSTCHEAPGVKETPEPDGVELHGKSLSPVEITYTLPERAYVSISIFDVSGKKVRTLVEAKMERGEHTLKWDCRDDRNQSLPRGIYFAMLATPGVAVSLPLIVLR